MADAVTLFSDGSSRGNPGPGGYGTVLRFTDAAGEVHERALSAGYRLTTNNRMELMGVIAGLEALTRPCAVSVFTDSQYVVNAFEQNWIGGWIARGWRTAGKKPVANVDLWQRLLAVVERQESVSWSWVRGHAGNELNERCDELACAAADNEAEWLVDEAYEAEAEGLSLGL